jgi:hypothetical protein
VRRVDALGFVAKLNKYKKGQNEQKIPRKK